MATNNFLNMVGRPARLGCVLAVHSVLCAARRHHRFDFWLFTIAASFYVLSVVPEFLIRFSSGCSPTPSTGFASSARNTCRRAGRRCSSATTCPMSTASWSARACSASSGFIVYKPYYDTGPSSAAEADEGDSGRADSRKGMRRVARAGAGDELQQRPRRLHLRRRMRSAAPATCCRSSAASSGSSTAWTCRSIPVYLDRVWGSIFSFKGGRFFWKWPVRVPYPVTVAFGAPLPSTTTAAEVRLAHADARPAIWPCGAGQPTNRLARQFVRTAKHQWRSFCMADATARSR